MKSNYTSLIIQRAKEGKLATVDSGKNSQTFYDGEKVVEIKDKKDFLNLAKNPNLKGWALVGENAHLGSPRGERSFSKAQPFTSEELAQFYQDAEKNDLIIGLFPQQSTPRATVYSQLEKNDLNDPISIHKLVTSFPQISLKKPNANFAETEVRKEGYKHKANLNAVLNAARFFDYSDSDPNAKFIRDNIESISWLLSKDAQDAFNLNDRYKVGAKKGKINTNKISMSQMYTILSILRGKIGKNGEITEDLNYRESQGKLCSWSFTKKYILNLGPFHRNGGVGRSNVMYHGERNYIIRKAKEEGFSLKSRNRGTFTSEEDAVFVKYRTIYRNSLKELFNAFSSLLTAIPDEVTHSIGTLRLSFDDVKKSEQFTLFDFD